MGSIKLQGGGEDLDELQWSGKDLLHGDGEDLEELEWGGGDESPGARGVSDRCIAWTRGLFHA